MRRPRFAPTLIDRYVIAEILPPTGLGLLLFTFILLLQQITILTGLLIARGADFPTILRLFMNILPSILATTIPMAFLLGVLLAFGRLAADSEIVALRASGVSPVQLLRPIVALSLLTGFITFYVLAVAVPNANQAYRQVFYALVLSKAKTGVKPRVFNDNDPIPQMVLYVADIPAESGDWRNVFISDNRTPQKPQVILARSGRLVMAPKARKVELHLEEGVAHAYQPNAPEQYEITRFKRWEMPLPFDQFFPNLPLSKGDREMTLPELLAQIRDLTGKGRPLDAARYWVEFHKKFAIPTACLVFGLLGLGLSLGSKKEARSAAFGLSIAVIFVYYVFIRLGEQAGDTGVLPPSIAMWAANVVLGAAAVLLLVLNHREAAFDPLDPAHYRRWLPHIRRARAPQAGPSAAGRPTVVVRIPRLRLPFRFPSLLDRYVGRQFLGHLVLVALGFWAIFLLVEFMDLFDDVQQNRVKGLVVVRYFAFHAPAVLHLIFAVAILVTTLTTFGILSRGNEVTAMKASGISVYRATLPVITLGLLGSLLLFGIGEFLLPYTNRVAGENFAVIKGRPPRSSSYLDRHWILGGDGRFYNYEYVVEGSRPPGLLGPLKPGEQFSLYGLQVYDIDASRWEIADHLRAARAIWNGVSYDVEMGWRRSRGPDGQFRTRAFEGIRTRELEPPSYFRKQEPESETLDYAALRDHIAVLESLGIDVAKLRVQLHRKLSFPLVSAVMVLVGIPFAFVVGRRGALYGIGLSIVIAIVYWTVLSVFEALGNNAMLPPLLAAWAPNLLFGAAGLYLMLTLDT
jgi:LPS export ABC transporter permease LptF/LPS export ABC transporter permease LptG